MKIAAIAVALVAAAALARAQGPGQVDCSTATGGVCSGVRESLIAAGKTEAEADNAVQILEANEGATTMNFDEPGTVDYIFTFKADGGSFRFCFGMCVTEQLSDQEAWNVITNPASTEEELEVARLAFAKDCVVDDGAKGFKIFDDRTQNPGTPEMPVIETISGLSSPISVVFWLIPNVAADFDIANFADSADAIYASSGDNAVRRPLFSVNAANQEGYDYLILFEGELQGNSRSLFLWEDKDRSSGQNQNNNDGSDSDFGDLVFAVNAILTPDVPVDDYFCDPQDGQAGSNPSVCATGVSKTSESTSVTISWGPTGKKCNL